MQIKSKVLDLLKLIITVILILYFIFTNDISSIIAYIERLSYQTWIVLFIIILVCSAINTLRWKIILNKCKFSKLLETVLISGFYSMIMPGQVLAEGVKVFLIKDNDVSKEEVAMSIIFDKISGILAVFISGIIGVILTKVRLPKFLLFSFCIGFSCMIFLLLIVKAPFCFSTIVKALVFCERTIPKAKILTSFVKKMIDAWCQYSNSFLIVISCLLLSILSQLLSVVAGYILSNAVGLEIQISEWFWIDAYVTLILLLPISIGGIGVREGALASALSLFNISTEGAVTVSFGLFCVQFFRALIGALVFMLKSKFRRENG